MAFLVYESNKSRVFINGIECFLLNDVRESDNYALDRVSGIGDIHVRQHVPTMAQHEVTLTGYMLRDEQMVSSGIIPENGDEALKGRTFSIEIFDKEGPLLRRYEEAMCNNDGATITKHALFMKEATFYATNVSGKFK